MKDRAKMQSDSAGAGRVRRSLLPTLRFVLIFAVSAPLALLILSLRPEAWRFTLLYPVAVLVLFAADLTMTLPWKRLGVTVHVPPRLTPASRGKRREECVKISLDAGDWDRPVNVEILPELSGDALEPLPVRGELAGRTDFFCPLAPTRRGRLLLDALWLRWRGPWGLAEMRLRQPVGEAVDVVPDVRGLHEDALRFFTGDTIFGSKVQRARGEGTEFEALREFAPGMDTRLIDWKRSARHRKLLGREFRQERNHLIVVGFDTGRLMLESVDGQPKLDHAVRAGLLLARVSLHAGDLIGACGFDARFRHFLPPERGNAQFSRFQRFSASLEYREDETNFTLALAELNSRLRRRSLIVLFTDFVDAVSAELMMESLQWLTRRHVVLFVALRDPLPERIRNSPPEDFGSVARAVVAGDLLRERAVVLERIARLGVHCLDVSSRELSPALLNRYLMIKQRGLL